MSAIIICSLSRKKLTPDCRPSVLQCPDINRFAELRSVWCLMLLQMLTWPTLARGQSGALSLGRGQPEALWLAVTCSSGSIKHLHPVCRAACLTSSGHGTRERRGMLEGSWGMDPGLIFTPCVPGHQAEAWWLWMFWPVQYPATSSTQHRGPDTLVCALWHVAASTHTGTGPEQAGVGAGAGCWPLDQTWTL